VANLTTLANLKEHLKIESGQTGDDTFLTNVVDRVSQFIKRYTGRVLNQTTLTETYDPMGGDSLLLRDWPVISVTSVHESFDHIFDATTLVAAADYYVNLRVGRIIRIGGSWFNHRDCVQVVYSAGYATIPTDLEMVALELCAAKWRKRRNEGLASKSLSDGSVVYFSAADLTKDLERALRLYSNAGVMP
jgi:hypothetical protein